ncbi:MAG: M28 family peptidase [Chitinophagaceae bacterium]|nr:M28 family peptidase [Chitinophagaceae bacterium]HMN32038.1 M28 family peptidase [Chitinophagaceae bacterium]
MIRISFLFICVFAVFNSFAWKVAPSNIPTPSEKIRFDIKELCSSQYEGRLSGTNGEELSAKYIEKRFKTIGINGYKNKYQWAYNFKGGTTIGKDAYFKIANKSINIGQELIFLPYSNGNKMSGLAMPKVYEPNNVWLVPISTLNLNSTYSPQKLLYEFASKCVTKEASSILFLNDVDATQDLNMQGLENFTPIAIPVAFLNFKAYKEHIIPNLKSDWIDINASLGYESVSGVSNNVIACIDNKAPFYVIVASHYDHLGNMGVLYPGADYNASGVAAMLALAEQVKNYGLKRFNYLFVAFSGNEFDFQGARGFIQQNEFLNNSITGMINLEMVGRLDDKKQLYLTGVGSSPFWGSSIQKANTNFLLHIDSSGNGYNDIRLFYEKNIPVLNISSGYTQDYKRYTDTEDKMNYNGIVDIVNFTFKIIADIDRQTKLIFNQTNDNFKFLSKLKNDIGVLHDFSFNQNGCRVATTLPNSKADKAGIMSGDVILKIGSFTIIDIDDYVEALSKSTVGKEMTIVVKRNKVDYKFFIAL